MNRKILVLDSSGTITDALPERFLVAHNSYIRINPTTNLFDPVKLNISEFSDGQKKFGKSDKILEIRSTWKAI